MIGIVSLLFCGITLKHYAYHNMSRRTRLGTKYIFQILAQMSENFIFIYLGLSLFTMRELVFKPTIIVITTVPPTQPEGMLTIACNLCWTMVCRSSPILHHQLPHPSTKPSSRYPHQRRRNPPILPSNAFLGRTQRSRRRRFSSRSRRSKFLTHTKSNSPHCRSVNSHHFWRDHCANVGNCGSSHGSGDG